MNEFEDLLAIVRRKAIFDQNNSWFKGSQSYLNGLKEEIEEVIEEIPKNRACYLEDELADVLWDYLNFVVALETEKGIKLDSVIHRARHKYYDRLSGVDRGEAWQDIKVRQKAALKKEQSLLDQINT